MATKGQHEEHTVHIIPSRFDWPKGQWPAKEKHGSRNNESHSVYIDRIRRSRNSSTATTTSVHVKVRAGHPSQRTNPANRPGRPARRTDSTGRPSAPTRRTDAAERRSGPIHGGIISWVPQTNSYMFLAI